MSFLRAFPKKLRERVSGSRVRYNDGEYDLDLTYITDRIIAMGFPAKAGEAVYRNNINDVAAMLNRHHKGHYMIYNLSEREYCYDKFDNQVLEEFGFPDHHSPPLNLLFKICKSIDSWLHADSSNVAVVHCLAGRGRTGTVIACYLTYVGLFQNCIDALHFFACKRSFNEKGVSVPSQLRYVTYFNNVLASGQGPEPVVLALTAMDVALVPTIEGGMRPVIQVFTGSRCLFNSAWTGDPGHVMGGQGLHLDTHIVLLGDITVIMKHKPRKGGSTVIGRVAFHTSFVHDDIIVFLKKDIDRAVKDKKVDANFSMTLTVRRLSDDMPSPDCEDDFSYDHLMPTNPNPKICFRSAPVTRPTPRLCFSAATEVRSAFDVDDPVETCCIDSVFIWLGHASGRVTVAGVETLATLAVYEGHSAAVSSIDIVGPVAVSCGLDGRVVTYDLTVLWQKFSELSESGDESKPEILPPSHINPIGIGPLTCGCLVDRAYVVGSNTGQAVAIATDTHLVLQQLDGHVSPVSAIAGSQGLVFTGDETGQVICWNGNFIETNRIRTHVSAVYSMCSGGKRLAVGGDSGDVRAYSLESLAPMETYSGHSDGPVVQLVAGTDGFIYTATGKTVRAFDPTSTNEVMSVEQAHTVIGVESSQASRGHLVLGQVDGGAVVHTIRRKGGR